MNNLKETLGGILIVFFMFLFLFFLVEAVKKETQIQEIKQLNYYMEKHK